jgi:hypothetical protein
VFSSRIQGFVLIVDTHVAEMQRISFSDVAMRYLRLRAAAQYARIITVRGPAILLLWQLRTHSSILLLWWNPDRRGPQDRAFFYPRFAGSRALTVEAAE